MADLKLGTSIAGSLTSSDPKLTTSGKNGNYYDEYNLTGVDNFTQLSIKLEAPAAFTGSKSVALINSSTGEVIDQTNFYSYEGSVLLPRTTAPGVSYKLRVDSASLGDYTLSTIDGGKATSIVSSPSNSSSSGGYPNPVGTIGASGTYFPLAASLSGEILDVALSPSGKLYGGVSKFTYDQGSFVTTTGLAAKGK